MEQLSYEKRGYLHEEFRLFHLTSAMHEPVDWHYHAFHKICVYLGGASMRYGVEGRSYALEPGDLVLVPQGCIHRPEIAAGAAYDRMLLYISPEFLRKNAEAGGALDACFQRAADTYHFVIRAGTQNRALLQPLFSLERTLNADGFAKELLVKSLFFEFLIGLTRCMDESDRIYASASAYDEKVAAILQYLSHHLTERISIDDLAARFYISKYHMMRRFRAQTAYTIHAYLVGKRLVLARKLILGGMPVMEAALTSGFGDYSAFSRAYRKQFGQPPSQLR